MAGVLDGDYESVEDAAKAALDAAFAIAAEKGKFTVVGQLMWSGGFIDHSDAAASKIALGHYATERQAQAAAESLVISTRSHEEMRAWVLNVHSGTPASYFQSRLEERKKAERVRGTGLDARLARRQSWLEANPGALVLPDTIDDETEHCNACGHILEEEKK